MQHLNSAQSSKREKEREGKREEEYVKGCDFNFEAVSTPEEKKKNWKDKLNGVLDGPYFVSAVVILVAIISFSLGRISKFQEEREPVKVISDSSSLSLQSESLKTFSGEQKEGTDRNINSFGQVVGSKNGTKYHHPWCPGAKQISAKNLITFNSIEEARAKGYTPAANCRGLK